MYRTVTIEWEGPVSWKNVVEKYSRDDSENCDYGIYQIYGPHELYANKKRPESENVLLYIGMTVAGSKFSGRISTQGFCTAEHEIYLGRIVGSPFDDNNDLWEQAVKDTEKVLINKYAPPFNAQHVGDLTKERLSNYQFIIENRGCKADLDEHVDSRDVVYSVQ